MRIGVLLFGILVPITFGLATPSFADSFAVGQAVILKAQKDEWWVEPVNQEEALS